MEPYQYNKELWLCENALFVPKEKTLIISDLQLGHEQQLRAMGSNIMYEQATQMLHLLETLIKQTGAKRLVINGDLKHEFGKISSQERRDILLLLSRLKNHVQIIVVKGNHDTMTKPLTDELGITLQEAWESNGCYAIHGHKLPDEKDPAYKTAHTIIIGHMHPAITLHDGVRKERYKCFLIGTYKRKQVVALPSFSTIVEGSDVLQAASNSPVLQDVLSSSVFVLADTIRPFGTVAALRNLLG